MKKTIYRISLLSSLFLALCVSCFDAKFDNPDDPFEPKKTAITTTSASATASTVGTMDASLWNFILVQTPSIAFTDYTSANGIITVPAGATTDSALEFKYTPTDADVSISVTFSAMTLASGRGLRLFARSAAAAEETNGSYMVSASTSAVKLYSRPTSGSAAAFTTASPVQLTSPVAADGVDHTLFFKVIGTLLTATIDGGSPITVTDTQFTSAGKVGIIVEKGCTIAIKSAVIKTGTDADSNSATPSSSPTSTATATSTLVATSADPSSWIATDWVDSAIIPSGMIDNSTVSMSASSTVSGGILTFDTTAAGTNTPSYKFPTTNANTVFTVAAKIQADLSTANAIDIDFANAAFRENVQITNTGIKLATSAVSYTMDTTTAYHTYLISYSISATGITTNVYVDGAATAFATGTNYTAATQAYFRIGDTSGTKVFKGYIDWFAYNVSGPFTPSTASLPSGFSL